MKVTTRTRSNNLTLDETLNRLAASPAVLGLALFGSRADQANNAISDYDLLLLVQDPPVSIFQMLTYIDGRMADLVFIPVEIANKVLRDQRLAPTGLFEEMFLLKMLRGQIVYDPSGRLKETQEIIKAYTTKADWPPRTTYSNLYAVWFWQNHGLFHMKRMVRSADPVYLTAVDLMLASGLSQVCRTHHLGRNIPWEGEKAAVRYLHLHNPAFLDLLQECIAAADRGYKLELYERLIREALAPIGDLWKPGLTSVYLSNPEQHETHLETALEYWETLLESKE